MKKYNKISPEGTRDFLFEECGARHLLKHRLRKLFSGKGYQEIMTPSLEFLDVFTGIPQEVQYKLSDSKGRLMAMRADNTMPIARVVATRLRNMQLPIRLFYSQKVFSVSRSMSGKSDEVMQSGIELIGQNGKRADLEVIVTAVEALRQCGVEDFKLELGHAGFFKAIARRLPIGEEERESIRSAIESKNYATLNMLLDQLEDNDAVQLLRRLPRLFGGEEILTQAAQLCSDSEANQVLAYLSELYHDLQQLKLGDSILIDLGLVHRNEYYTDVIFRGFIGGSGETVLSGGRYDSLLAEFGRELPATGFAVNVDCLAKALLGSSQIADPRPDTLVFGREGHEIGALIYANQLIEDGHICETSTADTLEEALAYAAEKQIRRVVAVGDSFETIQLV